MTTPVIKTAADEALGALLKGAQGTGCPVMLQLCCLAVCCNRAIRG
ncbi:hypothetical protein [uncultured Cohaesibacter sp.]|nr:hypothetical protein [uncultured Cohaesibacter sp.]